MGELDTLTSVTADIDDPSPRSFHYSFWQLVRLAFLASIGVSIASEYPCFDELDELENDLENLIHRFGNSTFSISVVNEIGRNFLGGLSNENFRGFFSLDHDKLPSFFIRTLYWICVCRISTQVDALLVQEASRHRHPASCSSPFKTSVELSTILDSILG